MNKSINMKKMTQKEFDDYMVMDLIPDVSEDEDSELVIVLTKKGKFKFAKECVSCHDFILLEKEYDLPKVVVDSTQTEETKSYLEILTGLDVYDLADITECECYDDMDDSIEIDEDDEYDEDCDYEKDDYLDEDSYDDEDY